MLEAWITILMVGWMPTGMVCLTDARSYASACIEAEVVVRAGERVWLLRHEFYSKEDAPSES